MYFLFLLPLLFTLVSMRFLLIIFLLPLFVFSQETTTEVLSDSLFREDQFYISIGYNSLQNRPSGYSQYSFSPVLSAGFLRDMPISKNRKLAVALGLGYLYTNTKHNLNIHNKNNLSLLSGFEKNTLSTYAVELPFELRWRNASPSDHKFLRVYLGFKMSYVFASKAKTTDESITIKTRNSTNLNKLQYGPYISAGYNTFNIYAYYGLANRYNNQVLNTDPLNVKALQVGLMFYIL